MTQEQDVAAVGRVLAGDIEAFAGIVRRWERPLVTLAFRFCRDRHRAEEMAQAAFLKAYRSLRQWRGDGLFSSWLFAVAANVYRSELRRRCPAPLPLDAANERVERCSTAKCSGEVEREELVRRAVSMLPRKYRDTLVLYYFHGMDVRQTALSLGIADGTVKARLHRGRALLGKTLSATPSPPTVPEELP